MLKDKVTICIPTNFVPTSPSSALVEYTLEKLIESSPELAECPVVISCDVHPERNGDLECEYVANLEAFACKSGGRITAINSQSDQGQRTSFLNMATHTKTPYMLHFEHDWTFTKHVPFDILVELMEKYEDMKFIAFSKKPIVQRGCDYILEDGEIPELPLLKSSRYSNNPHFARTSFWDVRMRALLGVAPHQSKHITEIPVFSAYKYDVKKNGFAEAQRDWGVYLYGAMGDAPVLHHTDGRKWRPHA